MQEELKPKIKMNFQEAMNFANSKEKKFEWAKARMTMVKNELLLMAFKDYLPDLAAKINNKSYINTRSLSELVDLGREYGVEIDLEASKMDALEGFCLENNIQLIQ